ncbi:uncharacterized protein LOC144478132, partial [Augochlora pura]
MLCRHRRFLSAVILLSYLCRDASATTQIRVIKEGSDFLLECVGDTDVFFIYPNNRTQSDTVLSSTSPIEISKNQNENGTYCYKIYRPRTVFGDTGWYGCSRDPILTTRHALSDNRVKWTYVYVE